MKLCLLLSTLLICSCNGTTIADDWNGWLGSQRDATWRESGVIDKFPAGGPELRWKSQLGGGYSGPSVAAGRVFVMDSVAQSADREAITDANGSVPQNKNFARSYRSVIERVVCLKESDGAVAWTHEYPVKYTGVSIYAIGPRATPTVDHSFVFTLGAEGNLKCLDVADGHVIWERDFVAEYGVETPNWGWACNPLIDGDRLICMVGGMETTCVAFNKATGEEIWRTLSAKEPGYCSPVIHEINGTRQLLTWDSHNLSGLDPETGRIFWTVEFPPTYAMSIGVPQVSGNSIFVMAFNRVSGRIDVAPDSSSAKIVWAGDSKRGIGGVHNTAVIQGGFVYGCGQGGNYICADFATGERLWSTFEPIGSKRPVSWGNVFTVKHRNRFFLANDQGDLIIANLTPQGYQELSRAKLIEPTHQVGKRLLVWSHPAFANKSVYLRNDKEIRCYSLAK